jgi:hypothetical protein
MGDHLHLQGMLHEIDVEQVGDPWPFVLMVDDAHGSTACQVHEEDAGALVVFFSRHLGLDVGAAAAAVAGLDDALRQHPGEPRRPGSTRDKKDRGRLAGALAVWEAMTGLEGAEAVRMARLLVEAAS